MNKRILLSDSNNIHDIHSMAKPRGHVIFKDPITGKVLYEKDNKVLVSGSQLTACALFDIDPWVRLQRYDDYLNLLNKEDIKDFKDIPDFNGQKQKSNIWLFCCGVDGGVDNTGAVKAVNYTGRINNIVPFQYVPQDHDLSGEEQLKYVGKATKNGSFFAYYFKTFENVNGTDDGTGFNRIMRYVDGTTINPDNLYDNIDDYKDAEVFVELNMRITKEDFRDYFKANDLASSARINCISLCSAWKKLVALDDKTNIVTYHDIIPVTQLNIPDESLVDLSKGIDITYQVYF